MSYDCTSLLTVNPLLRFIIQGQRVASYKGSYGGLKGVALLKMWFVDVVMALLEVVCHYGDGV